MPLKTNQYTDFDLKKNELQNAVLQPLAADPSLVNSKQGQMYFNTTTNRPRVCYVADATTTPPTLAWKNFGVVMSVSKAGGETVILVNSDDPENPVLSFAINPTQGEGVAMTKEANGLKVEVQDATTSQKGIVQLSSTPSASDETKAITPKGANITLVKEPTATAGYFATYTLRQGGQELATKIDIPKDFLVKRGSLQAAANYAVNTAYSKDNLLIHEGAYYVVTADITAAENTGWEVLQKRAVATSLVVGDRYLVFVINSKDGTAQEDYIVIPLGSLANVYLPLSGGTMAGEINMGSQKITNLATPSANTDAVNKSYADGKFLPLSGGTLTGDLAIASSVPTIDFQSSGGRADINFKNASNSIVACLHFVEDYTQLVQKATGGAAWHNGPQLKLNADGRATLAATDSNGANTKALIASSTGLTWDGNDVLTSVKFRSFKDVAELTETDATVLYRLTQGYASYSPGMYRYDVDLSYYIRIDTPPIIETDGILPSVGITDAAFYKKPEFGGYEFRGRYTLTETASAAGYSMSAFGLSTPDGMVTWNTVATNWEATYASLFEENEGGQVYLYQNTSTSVYSIHYGSGRTANSFKLCVYNNAVWHVVYDSVVEYLPLSGGTLTGLLTFSQYEAIRRSVDDSYLQLFGGTAFGFGANLWLAGKSYSSPGYFGIVADNGTNRTTLQGVPGGSLTWGNQPVSVCFQKVDAAMTRAAIIALGADRSSFDVLTSFATAERPGGQDGNYHVTVQKYSYQYVVMRATKYQTGGNTYQCYCSGGTWSDWALVQTQANSTNANYVGWGTSLSMSIPFNISGHQGIVIDSEGVYPLVCWAAGPAITGSHYTIASYTYANTSTLNITRDSISQWSVVIF